MPQKAIEWQALEYRFSEKSPEWFWAVGIVGGAAAFLALLFKNILLAIILVLGTFTILLYGKRPPEKITFGLTPRGVRVKNQLYPYDYLKSFWVDEEAEDKKIIIETKKVLTPHLILPLAETLNPEEIKQYLAAFLPAVRHEHSLVDILGDILGL